jgi:hypothetical protein
MSTLQLLFGRFKFENFKMKTDIDKYLNQLKKGINKTKKTMAKTALSDILAKSPVRLGAYVKSNRVGIGFVDSTHEPVFYAEPPYIPPAMPVALAIALKKTLYAQGSARIEKAEFNKNIFISNSIPYAALVEHIGWEKTGPYAVYSKAILKLKAKTFLQSQAIL